MDNKLRAINKLRDDFARTSPGASITRTITGHATGC
jgi:hypothetical protein